MASTSDSTTDAPVINPRKDPVTAPAAADTPAAAAPAEQPAEQPAEHLEWEPAAADDPNGDDKGLVLAGLASTFTVTTSDNSTYTLGRAPLAVLERHLKEVRQAAMNHRIKLRTMQVVKPT